MKFKVVFVLAVLALVATACGGGLPIPGAPQQAAPTAFQPSAMPTVVSAPVTNPTIVPTSEVVATQAVGSNCQQYYTEEFDTANSCWDINKVQITSNNPDPKSIKVYLAGGGLNFEYAVSSKTMNTDLYLYLFNDVNSYNDVILETSVVNVAPGNVNDAFALVCRQNDKGWYEGRVTGNGFFNIYFYDRSLKDAGKNPYVNLGGAATNKVFAKNDIANKIRFECVGNALTLKANGTELLSVNIAGAQPGYVGIGSITAPGAYPVAEKFENLTISKP
jgi:hypothetical protein